MISLDISELHPLRARCKLRLSLGYTGTCKNPPGSPHPRPEGVTQPPVCSIVVGIRGIPISSRIKRAPLPLWGLTPSYPLVNCLLPSLPPPTAQRRLSFRPPLYRSSSFDRSPFFFSCFQPGYRNFPCLCFVRARGGRGMARVRCFFFLSVFIRYIRFDSLGSPSGWKVFERDSSEPRSSRFWDTGISGKRNRNFRELSISGIGFSGN